MKKLPLVQRLVLVVFLVLCGAGAALAQSTYKPTSVFLSPEKEAPMPFTGLAVKWHQVTPPGTAAAVSVRFRTDGGWGEWTEFTDEQDEKEAEDLEYPAKFIATDKATAYQYKVALSSEDPNVTPVLEDFEFTYIHARDENAQTMAVSLNPPEASFLASRPLALRVISRSEWGADENLRVYKDDRPEPQLVKLEDDFYETFKDELVITRRVVANADGETLTWPLEYPEKVSKFIIHHTATSKNLENPKQAIRDIYYWHAMTRGWGDIGYNYIIDQQGNIYEGRYGGDGVVGAHAGRANIGSIGIAVLGNYEENEVPEPVISSLSALMKAKASKYNLDTMGASMFRGEMLPNVLGHRDVMSTTCPGSKLYELLSTIRALAKNAFTMAMIDKRRTGQNDQYNYDIAEDSGIFDMDGGMQKTMTLKIKNTGQLAWDAQTYFMLSNSKSTQKYLASTNRIWKSTSAGKQVNPGETATFQIPLIASHIGGFTTFEAFPMIDGTTKIEKYVSVPVQIKGSYYDYKLININIPKKILRRGETMEVEIALENSGDTAWNRIGKNKVMIGTENPRDHIARILEKPSARLANLTESSVEPGEVGHFTVKVQAPVRAGYYREYFAPVVEGITWMPHRDNYIDFYVGDSASGARYAGKSFTNELFQPGEKRTITLEFENIGSSTWEKDGASPFRILLAKNASLGVTGVELQQDKVGPGETAAVSMTIQAPEKEGVFRIIVTPQAGSKHLMLRPVPIYVRVSRSAMQPANPVDTKEVSAPAPLAVAAAARSESTSDIRIGLSFEGDPVISADGSFELLDNGQSLKTFNADEKIAVTYEQGKYQIKGNSAAFVLSAPPRFEPPGTAILRIDNYEHRPAWNQNLNDNTYRGALEVHWYDGKLVVVNELPLEEYLKGLAEIDPKQHFEKIKAIIVLARSYAKYYMTIGEKFPGAPYHLSDDPARSQFYLGYGFEQRNVTGKRAVEATANEVVTYQGAVIKTPYFSSSDGRTRSAEEVWGWTNTPYLQSVADPGCEGQELRGHGVGLSGCGALYWAEQGKTYKEIIKYYFQGVEVEQR